MGSIVFLPSKGDLRLGKYVTSKVLKFEPDLAWLNESHGNEDDFDQRTKAPRAGTNSSKTWQHIEPITEFVSDLLLPQFLTKITAVSRVYISEVNVKHSAGCL